MPIIPRLADALRQHLERLGRELLPGDRVFPGVRAERFSDGALLKRSRKRWEAAGLKPVGLHDCRHTFASFGIAAGWNAKTLQVYIGHSSIQVTFDITDTSSRVLRLRQQRYSMPTLNGPVCPTVCPKP